jgi:hypothetical protein
MPNEIEINEQDLEHTRQTNVLGYNHQTDVTSIVLSRAGKATPPGHYCLINGKWQT